MENHHQLFYCYINQGTPVVQNCKPEKFEELPCHYIAHCPNAEIAELTYRSNLRIEGWRSN